MDEKETPHKTEQNGNTFTIYHRDGTTTEAKNPFAAMQATYQALANDPQAMPELSDESRERILAEIARDREKKIKEMLLAAENTDQKPFYPPALNRHERRKQAALARKVNKK
ncbi:MAG: hypothetical protein CVU46_09575 [Chloroflexi bacterium HGW-Chloroflexi-8]|nr:MAG: hypothetical protein CVU46_09575 [Chloroflexi bacterium HGW-Chloroflexi-8]